ncbi:MAG: haloacid dehalogenase [Herpetosiphonaceae bacterium]|nr:haloacid dehalogenase [Herpetosiphonaceae bacterium]
MEQHMSISLAGEAALAALESRNATREAALVLSRALIRQCANTIRAIHRHNWEEADQLGTTTRTSAASLREQLAPFPGLYHTGYVQDALKEYAEARLLLALVRDLPVPTHVELEIEPAAYLNGLAEAASELRRYLLDSLRAGSDAERGAEHERLLGRMDEIYSLLVTVDYPDALTGGLRRTTDALRAVLERTRGDLTTSVQQQALLDALRHGLQHV